MSVLKNAKHEAFAQAVAAGKSLVDAHEMAGYPRHRGNAYSVAQRLDIKGRVAELLNRRDQREFASTERAIERTAITKTRVATELAKIAFASMGDYTRAEGTSRVLDLTNVTEDQLAAVQQLETDVYVQGKGETAKAVVRVKKFRLHDKRQALMDIAALFGYVIKRTEVREVDEFETMDADALKERVSEIIAGGRAEPTRH
jgi:phage terminase small subunit